jgi:hypothetical protein
VVVLVELVVDLVLLADLEVEVHLVQVVVQELLELLDSVVVVAVHLPMLQIVVVILVAVAKVLPL